MGIEVDVGPLEGLSSREESDEMTEYECTIDAIELKTLDGHPVTSSPILRA
jgi:hypothetical protein